MRLEYQLEENLKHSAFREHFLDEKMLFVDIETTGLSPKNASVYCIGCSNLSSDGSEIRLFFADSPDEEVETLKAFMEFASGFSTILTFNGTTFDLPFLQKRCDLYDIDDTLTGMVHIDLFRKIRSFSPLLQLPGYRQKCVEQFLGIDREDQYNGGQLIQVYHDYCSSKDPELYHLLYIHNFEDIKGMYDLIDMLTYEQLYEQEYTLKDTRVESEGETAYQVFEMELPYPVPQTILLPGADHILMCTHRTCIIKFPIRSGNLRHYFEDYKNYYYLPEEHTVVHKSVGQYMDPAFRTKATKDNCYIDKQCQYISFPWKKAKTYLRQAYKDPNYYMELSDSDTNWKDFIHSFFTAL